MKRAPLVYLLWLALATSGCSDSEEVQTTRKKITLEPTIKAPIEDPTKKMATAVAVGKTVSDFQLKYQFGTKPEVATLCPLEIALISQTTRPEVEVEITGMEGIELDGSLAKTIDLKRNEPYLMRFTVVPLRVGVFYVTVTTKVTVAGETVEQAFNIPFIAGDLKTLGAKPLEEQMSAAGSSLSPATDTKTGSERGELDQEAVPGPE